MPSTSKLNEASGSSKPLVTPYEQQYRTVIQKHTSFSDGVHEIIQREGWNFGTFRWGSISFGVSLEMNIESPAELFLKVTCNRGCSDPHWRCEFIVTANANQEQEMVACQEDNELVMKLRRLPACPAGGHDINWSIRMTSWSGVFPPLLYSFSSKTDISDATLIVEGKPLYVSRALLALHSTFFNTLFFDDKFPDAAKDEFPLADVSYDDMVLYLQLVSPNIADDTPEELESIDAVESMLALAERFGNDTLTLEMEQHLMGKKGGKIRGLTTARALLIADRFRLSEPASHIMQQLLSEADRLAIGDTEEYWQLSADLKAALLDASMRRHPQQTEASETSDPRLSSTTRDSIDDLFFRIDNAFDMRQMRLRRARPRSPPDPRRYRRRSPAAAASSSTNTASDLSFETFTTDVTRLGIAFNEPHRTSSFPRQRMDALRRILEYFGRLSRADYLRLPYERRDLIHDLVRHVVAGDVARADTAIVALNVAVDLAQNDLATGADSSRASNRSVEAPARKRMRMRDYVLDPSP